MKSQKDIQEQFLKGYNEHSDALFRYALFKIGDRELAKDLVQDTFTRTWDYLCKGRNVDNMKSFLYRTLTNAIIDEYRKKKTVSLDEMREAGADFGQDLTGALIDQMDGVRAFEMLKKLPDDYREIITMRYVEELSLQEIADRTGHSIANVAVKIHRGIAKVKKIYEEKQHHEHES